MFYDRFKQLCDQREISVTKAVTEIGLSRALGTKWKNTGATPNGETLKRIADYFGVSTEYLLGVDSNDVPTVTFDDFTYAMHGASGKLTDKDKEILLSMAQQLVDANTRKAKKSKHGEIN